MNVTSDCIDLIYRRQYWFVIGYTHTRTCIYVYISLLKSLYKTKAVSNTKYNELRFSYLVLWNSRKVVVGLNSSLVALYWRLKTAHRLEFVKKTNHINRSINFIKCWFNQNTRIFTQTCSTNIYNLNRINQFQWDELFTRLSSWLTLQIGRIRLSA